MIRTEQERKESAKALGFSKYVREMAAEPNTGSMGDVLAGELSRDDREAYAKAHGRPWPKPATTPRCLTVTIAQARAAAWADLGFSACFTDSRRVYCRVCGERGPRSDDVDLCRECERGEADHQALSADADRDREAEYLAALDGECPF